MLYTKDREKIVKEALAWENTPYRGWSRTKYFGADCIGFVAGVFVNTEHITEKEASESIPKSYSLQHGQHEATTEYVDGILKFMQEISESEVRAGDVAMFKISLAFSHSAIVVKWPLIIHSSAHGGVKLADAKKLPMLNGKAVRFFTIRDGR